MAKRVPYLRIGGAVENWAMRTKYDTKITAATWERKFMARGLVAAVIVGSAVAFPVAAVITVAVAAASIGFYHYLNRDLKGE
jgi:hypothetical protein